MSITKAEIDREILFSKANNGRIAIITIDRQKKLNALTQHHYFRIAELLHEIADMPEVVVTVVTGRGRFFSAGADVSIIRKVEDEDPLMTPRKHWTQTFVSNNLHNTHAWYSHPKVLITALNGPAVGISAALIAHSDFIYAAPHAWLLTPFTSLGLNAEGAASKAFVDRMGMARANEALLMSKKMLLPKLLQCGFVNGVIDGCGGDKETGKGIDTDKFLDMVLKEVDERLGPHLVSKAILDIKKQIRSPGMALMDRAGVEEVWGGLNVFLKGIPQEEFRRIASGEKRHKL